MVDKLRKFGELLWLNKERLILVAMVAILCYQVYKVVYPDERPRGNMPVPPKPTADSAPQPPQPPDKPIIALSGDYVGLYRNNMFWRFSGNGQRGSGTNAEDLGIKLLDIQGRRAQIQTQSTTKWYTEGDAFEQYRLESVDAANNSAVVYIEGQGKNFTIKIE